MENLDKIIESYESMRKALRTEVKIDSDEVLRIVITQLRPQKSFSATMKPTGTPVKVARIVEVTDTLLAVGDLHISPTSAAVTIAGSPADADYCIFQVVCKTSGSIAVDTKLMGIMIHWS